MVGKLSRLPVETQEALQQLACLGNIAEHHDAVASFSGHRRRRSTRHLWEAVRLELVEWLEGAYGSSTTGFRKPPMH